MLIGLITVCAVSTVALARLVAVLRIYTRQRGYSLLTGAFTNSNSNNANGSILSTTTTAGGVASSSRDSSRILVPSLLFHVLLFLCLVTEVPVYAFRYAATLHGGIDVARPLYALHLCSYLLLFSAFCVIVTLWSDVAVFEPNEWTTLMNRFDLLLPQFLVMGRFWKALVKHRLPCAANAATTRENNMARHVIKPFSAGRALQW